MTQKLNLNPRSAYFVLHRHCPPRLTFAICGQWENKIVNIWINRINEMKFWDPLVWLSCVCLVADGPYQNLLRIVSGTYTLAAKQLKHWVQKKKDRQSYLNFLEPYCCIVSATEQNETPFIFLLKWKNHHVTRWDKYRPESQHTFQLTAFQDISMLGSLSTQLTNKLTLKTKPFSRFFILVSSWLLCWF